MIGLAWLAAAVLLSGGDPTEEDWDWLNDHREAAFEALMPAGGIPQARVTYRSYRTLYQDVPERYFTIFGPIESLEAIVVAPEAGSVQQQLLDMHIADPEASFESLLQRVQVRRIQLGTATCPAIRVELNRLTKLKVPPPTRDVIILHPMLHRILIDFGGGRVDASLTENDHPLVAWALHTLAALQRCPEHKLQRGPAPAAPEPER